MEQHIVKSRSTVDAHYWNYECLFKTHPPYKLAVLYISNTVLNCETTHINTCRSRTP